MCGICGELRFTEAPSQLNWPTLLTMMMRRGPDDEGLAEVGSRCTLGFRRLAVMDLSEAGHQPMVSHDGRYALVYNGEVYNFGDVGAELRRRGCQFRSSGDTEVVLHALITWGTKALDRLNGMFALAFYDRHERSLLIARDHAGIKPLYYCQDTSGFFFASQYNQVLQHPAMRHQSIHPLGLDLYLRRLSIPVQHQTKATTGALHQGIHMLPPGCWLKIDQQGRIHQERYASFPEPPSSLLSGKAAVEAVSATLKRVVKRQLISNVPVGTFLSGGIDSPLVTALARTLVGKQLTAFTIGLDGHERDESKAARRYAEILDLNHRVIQANSEGALALLNQAVSAMSEPLAEYSLLPLMMVAQEARQHVTVMLSGDGGDELFWGYQRTRRALNDMPRFTSPYAWRKFRSSLAAAWHRQPREAIGRYPHFGSLVRALQHVFPDDWLTRIWPDRPKVSADQYPFEMAFRDRGEAARWVRQMEFDWYLPGVLLKVDRGSMFHSVEVRVPLLDREMIEIAALIEWQSCIDFERGLGKQPLRQVLAQQGLEPTQTKWGFTLPVDEWLRGPLHDLFEDQVIAPAQFMGVPFCREGLRAMFRAHLNQEANFKAPLWALLILALWEKEHLTSRAVA